MPQVCRQYIFAELRSFQDLKTVASTCKTFHEDVANMTKSLLDATLAAYDLEPRSIWTHIAGSDVLLGGTPIVSVAADLTVNASGTLVLFVPMNNSLEMQDELNKQKYIRVVSSYVDTSHYRGMGIHSIIRFARSSPRLGSKSKPKRITIIETAERFPVRRVLSSAFTTATMAFAGPEGLTRFFPKLMDSKKAIVRFENVIKPTDSLLPDKNFTGPAEFDVTRESPLGRELIHLDRLGFKFSSPYDSGIRLSRGECMPTCHSQFGNVVFETLPITQGTQWNTALVDRYTVHSVWERRMIGSHALRDLVTDCNDERCRHWGKQYNARHHYYSPEPQYVYWYLHSHRHTTYCVP